MCNVQVELPPFGIGGNSNEDESNENCVGNPISHFNPNQKFSNNEEETTANEEEEWNNNTASMEKDDTADTNQFPASTRVTEENVREVEKMLLDMHAQLKE